MDSVLVWRWYDFIACSISPMLYYDFFWHGIGSLAELKLELVSPASISGALSFYLQNNMIIYMWSYIAFFSYNTRIFLLRRDIFLQFFIYFWFIYFSFIKNTFCKPSKDTIMNEQILHVLLIFANIKPTGLE